MKTRYDWAFWLTGIAGVQFVVLTGIAMLIYPGGSLADPTTSGYSFFGNCLSALGMTVSPGGYPNLLSAILFLVAMTGAGLGLCLFFLALPHLFRSNCALYTVSWIGSLLGIVAGFGFVGVGWSPANLLPAMHGYSVLVAFYALLAAATCYTVVAFLKKGFPKILGFGYLALALALLAFLTTGVVAILLQWVPAAPIKAHLIAAAAQKLIVYMIILFGILQSIGTLRFIKRLAVVPQSESNN